MTAVILNLNPRLAARRMPRKAVLSLVREPSNIRAMTPEGQAAIENMRSVLAQYHGEGGDPSDAA